MLILLCLYSYAYTLMREGTFVSFRILIHRDSYELMGFDVFCFGNFGRYIGVAMN